MQKRIYFDNNATSLLHPSVSRAMQEESLTVGNPSSVHIDGQMARNRMNAYTSAILKYLNATNYKMIITSGGSEANNLALHSDHICKIFSAIEHPSILKQTHHEQIYVLKDGTINIDHLKELLEKHKQEQMIISVMYANNETGIIQPIKEIANIVHAYNGILHTDAVQAFGKIPIDCNELDVDMVTIACHKAGGPIGIGALLVKDIDTIKPLMSGGLQQHGMRPGTENIPALRGFAESCLIARNDDALSFALLSEFGDEFSKYFLMHNSKLHNTFTLSMHGGPSSHLQTILFDQCGISVGAGSACSSGTLSVSYVLQAMKYEHATTAIRISFGWQNTIEEIKAFALEWKRIYAANH